MTDWNDLSEKFSLKIEEPILLVNSGGKYQKKNRKMLILALEGLIEEVSCNQINSTEWKFYSNIIKNLTNALEIKEEDEKK